MVEEGIDVGKHRLVPKHEKMTEEEVSELLEKYQVSLKQLPKILLADPALRGLDAEVFDVVRISRKSPTSGDVKYYRVVVNG
jgi:DNA-directed RNA polymerase subunit H